MNSDLEIENAASLTLRRIVARAVEAANDRALISPLARSAGSDAELKPSVMIAVKTMPQTISIAETA